MVNRISIVSENLVAAVAVQTRCGRAGNCVGESVGGDLPCVGAGVCDYDRVRRAGPQGLDTIAGFSQVDSPCAHVTHLQNPALAEFALYREVPLLRVGHNEVPRDFEDKEILGGVCPGSVATIVNATLVGVVACEASKLRQAGYPVG